MQSTGAPPSRLGEGMGHGPDEQGAQTGLPRNEARKGARMCSQRAGGSKQGQGSFERDPVEVLGMALYCDNRTKPTPHFQELPSQYGSTLGPVTAETHVRFGGRVM